MKNYDKIHTLTIWILLKQQLLYWFIIHNLMVLIYRSKICPEYLNAMEVMSSYALPIYWPIFFLIYNVLLILYFYAWRHFLLFYRTLHYSLTLKNWFHLNFRLVFFDHYLNQYKALISMIV